MKAGAPPPRRPAFTSHPSPTAGDSATNAFDSDAGSGLAAAERAGPLSTPPSWPTPQYYVLDPGSGDILVSTMAERQKAKAVARDGKVSLCVLDEHWPLTYLQVYGDAVIEDDLDAATELMRRIIVLMSEGQEVPEKKMATVRTMCAEEHRVVVRVTPYATFATPPRHTHSPEDIDTLTHWTSSSQPR